MTTSTTPENTPGNTPGNITDETNEAQADFDALALLAGLQGANAHQLALLKVITDPANNDGGLDGETHLEIAECYEDDFSGYLAFGSNTELQTVADFLHNHYATIEDAPDFSFGFESNSEGEIGGYNVSATFGSEWDNRITLTSFHDIKHSTTDREATGLKAALSIAETLDFEYRALVAKGRKRGLMNADADAVEAATRALAAYDAVPADEDVDVDTMAMLRDSLAALLTAQGITTP